MKLLCLIKHDWASFEPDAEQTAEARRMKITYTRGTETYVGSSMWTRVCQRCLKVDDRFEKALEKARKEKALRERARAVYSQSRETKLD